MKLKNFPGWAIILGGFLIGGRNFAYVGIPPLFIGEAYMGISFLKNRGNWLGRFVDDVFEMKPLAVGILLQLSWAFMEAIRCLFDNTNPIEVLRTAAFSYYCLYILIGAAVGRHLTLRQFTKAWKWIIVLWAVMSLGEFAQIYAALPFGLFGPAVGALFPVIMIALWPHLRDWSLRHIVLIGSVLISVAGAGRGRGGVLALGAGFISIACGSRQRFYALMGAMLGAVTVGFIVAPLIPGDTTFGAIIDPVTHVAGLLATDHPEMASKIMRNRGHLTQADVILLNTGTASWRQTIWRNALNSLNTTTLRVLGKGGGASMSDLVPDKQDVHSPHNFAIFCIYYLGWGGLVVMAILLATMMVTCRRLRDPVFRDAGCAVIWGTVLMSFVGNVMETPGGAIPFYMIVGLMIGLDERPAAVAAAAAAARRLRRQPMQQQEYQQQQRPRQRVGMAPVTR